MIISNEFLGGEHFWGKQMPGSHQSAKILQGMPEADSNFPAKKTVHL